MASFMPDARVHLLDIPTLDDDHLALGHIIAELELLGENNASGTVVANVIARLIAAARLHFAREEEIMAHEAYPFLACHRESHCQLIEFIEDLAGQLSSGRITLNKKVIAGLWDWEITHIDTADRDYAEYAKNRKPAPVTSG
jgi:hemerythrin-like metal-binding protein